ncbi:hypothetical protein [Pedobacter heparinus]|uniref:Uncharacterized protein n=1 Tax=Pedobacter heparinus (strain ATCC 13125 / DSM 2366 / CIP 104194 / JCM 7457 / NBRC 12017 / NCIMB 9290 / NRRL B-14731 / HIM 762-3) TaxID=485917 RepID=C6XW64_PEDHD|nr:hypothetical protein [Pedobacter heparinus]ACU04143.1 hypothetical protein Phep_1935 [Pedobacter heparinus DSM 2366]
MNFTFYKINTQLMALKAITCLLLSIAGLSASGQNKAAGKIHVGIIYPLSTNGSHAALDTNNLSIHLLAGISASEQGASFAGISNIVRNGTKGFQFAAFSNHIGKQVEGGLFAGFLNTYAGGDAFAVAGFSNVATADVKGAQFAGFANVSKSVKGAQFAGFANIAKTVKGPQFAGFINLSKKDAALQFAGFMNKATDVKGSQLAGFINIAKKVKGAQIAGFINVADSSDYPIGIINIVKNGEKGIGISTDETLTTMLSFRSGGKVLYGIIGIGYNFKNTDEVYAFEAGLGAHFFQSPTFRLNAEIAGTGLESFKAGEYFKTSFRLMPAFKISPKLEIFGGPSVNYLNTNTFEGRSLNKSYINTWENKWGNNFQALYIGYGGGIQYLF